MSVKRY